MGSYLGVFLLGAWGGEWSSLPQEAGARAGAHELMSVSRGCEQVSPLGVPTQTGATAWLHLSLSLLNSESQSLALIVAGGCVEEKCSIAKRSEAGLPL